MISLVRPAICLKWPWNWNEFDTPALVVLKREPLGSLREEFLIPGRKYVLGSNWGGKGMDEKGLNFYHLFINTLKLHKEVGSEFRWECLQYARSSCFNYSEWR